MITCVTIRGWKFALAQHFFSTAGCNHFRRPFWMNCVCVCARVCERVDRNGWEACTHFANLCFKITSATRWFGTLEVKKPKITICSVNWVKTDHHVLEISWLGDDNFLPQSFAHTLAIMSERVSVCVCVKHTRHTWRQSAHGVLEIVCVN